MTKRHDAARTAARAAGSGRGMHSAGRPLDQKHRASIVGGQEVPQLRVLPPATSGPREPGKKAVLSPNRIKVLVVDDHPMVEDWIGSLMGADAEMLFAGHAASLEETASLVERQFPSLVVMELGNNAAQGLEVVRGLHLTFPTVRMLVFSSCDEVMYSIPAVRAGARGFVSKSAKGPELLRAIQVVLEDGVHLSSAMIGRLAASAPDTVTGSSGPVSALSSRELQVFNFVGNGLRPTEIAQRISLSVKTVETYLVRIREKLELRDARALFQEAVRWTKTRA